MAQNAFVVKDFSGGWSTDKKVGIEHSFAYSQAIDFRKKPSQITVLPQPKREDQGNVKDLIQNIVITKDGTIYGIGNGGFFYRRNTSGIWSAVSSMVAGTFGMDYRKTPTPYTCAVIKR